MDNLTITERAIAERAFDLTKEYLENILKLCDGQKASFSYSLIKTCAEMVDETAEELKEIMLPSLLRTIREIMRQL